MLDNFSVNVTLRYVNAFKSFTRKDLFPCLFIIAYNATCVRVCNRRMCTKQGREKKVACAKNKKEIQNT